MRNELLFQNQFRIPSTRLQYWNYAQDGWYFVTICTHKRECFLGEINNYEPQLSPVGQIAEKCWLEIPQHFPNVELETFVIMPNHIHGIITINCTEQQTNKNNIGQNLPLPQSLSAVIGSFKSAVSKIINRTHPKIPFQWQTRFYDRIIRNRESMYKISQYILNNPIKWELDRNNPKNVY
ncbi:MAG: transposase [Candidatus Falkowbacteria bacterium]